jgi:hypothetical protein
MYVSNANATVLTVVRGVNGTTAATQTGVAIQRMLVPDGVKQWVIDRSAERFARSLPAAIDSEANGENLYGFSADIRLLNPYRMIAV